MSNNRESRAGEKTTVNQSMNRLQTSRTPQLFPLSIGLQARTIAKIHLFRTHKRIKAKILAKIHLFWAHKRIQGVIGMK